MSRVNPLNVPRNSGMRSRAGEAVPIGSYVYAAANPNTAKYVSPNGATVTAAVWPKLMDILPSSRYGKTTNMFTATYPFCTIHSGPGAQELIAVASQGVSSSVWQSLNNGQTWTAKGGISMAQMAAPLGGNWWSYGCGADIAWDASTSRYVILTSAWTGDGAGNDWYSAQLYQSTDLVTWTYVGVIFSLFGNNNPSTYGRCMIEKNAAGDWVICSGADVRTKAGALNTASGWTTRISEYTSGFSCYKLNGIFVAAGQEWAQPSASPTYGYRTSPDGVTWTNRNAAAVTAGIKRPVAYGNGVYIMTTGYQSAFSQFAVGTFYYTTDFVTHTQLNNTLTTAKGFPSGLTLMDAMYNPVKNHWMILYLANSAAWIATSTDLVNWNVPVVALPSSVNSYSRFWYEPQSDSVVLFSNSSQALEKIDPEFAMKLPNHSANTQVRKTGTWSPWMRAAT